MPCTMPVRGAPPRIHRASARMSFDPSVWALPSNHANAELLRIIEAHAFTRAFKSWTGTTPAQFRTTANRKGATS